MGLFDFGKKDKAIKELRSEVQELKKLAGNSRGFDMAIANITANFNRNIALYPPYDIMGNSDRYVTTDDIYSIVRMLATTAALIPLRAYQVKEDKAFKELKSLRQPHTLPLRAKYLELKALIDLPETDPLAELLESPSYSFSVFEWYEAIYTSLYLNGESIILKERPGDGVNAKKPVSLLLLHPANVILMISDTFPRQIVSYAYKINGVKVFENIPAEDVIHIKYFNPDIDYSGSELRGLSPIKVLSRRLTQLDSNTNVTTAQMQNGGVETIVYDKSLANEEAAVQIVGQRKDTFYKFLKNPANAGTPYFASGEMGAIQLGSTLADLKVLESAGINFKKLCNVFGTSDILFNNGEASTESNVREMVKRTYTNTTLPNVYRVRDALIKGLLPDFSSDRIKRFIREDISEIAELQPNMKDMAEWLAISPQITYNERREMMRFEKLPEPIFDQPFLPSGLQTAEDLAVIPPIDMITPNGN